MSPRMVHRALVRIALSGAHVFAWIFVFQYFYVRSGSLAGGVASTALTYALSHAIVVLLTPYAATRLRNGFKWTLVFATLSLAAAFAILSASFAGHTASVGWGVGLFAILMGIYRGLYWVPYEIAQTVYPARASRSDLLIALSPALAGLFLTSSAIAPVELLGASAIVALFALVPLARMQDVVEGYSWSYRGTFHQLFADARRPLLVSSVVSGIEAAALLLLWPLAMFMLFKWSYPTLGIVLTITFIITHLARRALHRPMMHASTGITAFSAVSAWVMRLAVGGAVGAVLVDTFFYTGSQASARGVDMLSFEQAADNNTYIDEHTALKEIGMGIGRILLCLFVVSLSGAVSIAALFIIAFVVAALAAAASVYLSHRPKRRLA